jgi:hypothetical protein
MKIVNSIIVALAFCLLANANAYSETIFQTVPGEAATTSDGAKALDKKLIELKSIPGDGNVARIPGSMTQWGYVNFWFGLPAPAGSVVVRFKVYVDDTTTASYGIYIRVKNESVLITKLAIPADAKKNAFVNVDVPVTQSEEWNGLSLKKMDASTNPSPWIESVSIVQP